MPSSKRSGKILTNEYKVWLNGNPLTVWMRRTKRTQMEVAAKLGVSTYAVYLWQHGTSVPKPEAFAKIRKLTSIKDIIKEWEVWKNEYIIEADTRK